MRYVTNLTDENAAKVYIAGGKGSKLHRLLTYGYSVPDGFIVDAVALQVFLEANGLQEEIEGYLARIRDADVASLAEVSKRIRGAIVQAPLPRDLLASIQSALTALGHASFAVRSSAAFEDSATSSWAGLFDSFLSVSREDVPAHVRRCWASLFNSRALSYSPNAFEALADLEFAVVVQRMLNSDVSGVAFSVDPVGGDRSKVLIEAAPGVGQGLVSGGRVPFSATMDKQESITLRKVLADEKNAQLLSTRQLGKLCEEVTRAEMHFRTAVDIEWSFVNGNLYLLQVRPITALPSSSEVQETTEAYPDIQDYELTFKVSGLSFLFCDMLMRGFGYLAPLFTSDETAFRQYFPNTMMEYAARYGYKWLSHPTGFERYQAEFELYHEHTKTSLSQILDSDSLTPTSCHHFFKKLSKFFTFYSKMDFQFTNTTYVYAAEHPVLKENLDRLSLFKDTARVWLNALAIVQDSAFARFSAKLAAQFSIDSEHVELYKITDLTALFEGSTLNNEQLSGREKSYSMFIHDGRRIYLTGDASQRFIHRITQVEEKLARSELVGQVANKLESVVTGTVRIINVDYGDMETMEAAMAAMEEGEILVSEFTSPELMLACKKAKAIVTDLGGMLSHAAIVCRELGIPCLVGTKSATRALATGDSISIDFVQGRIEKLASDI